jgi:DNA polymerase-3 subunit epsilon
MNLALFYDTETTGLPLFKEPSEHPDQPHIVQLAAALVDLDTRNIINSIDLVIKPDGWTIPDAVAAIHGITTEHAMDVGVPAHMAIEMFLEMWGVKRTRIAHNEQFDARLVRIACMRHAPQCADMWKDGKAECTAIMATPIVKAPPTAKMIAAGRNHYKTANLAEAVLHLTGKPLVNAHSAMADVTGCMDVYFAIRTMADAAKAA